MKPVLVFCRTAAEAMVMNPPEPAKEKEKQGFFRSIKKKKKKTQIVRKARWLVQFVSVELMITSESWWVLLQVLLLQFLKMTRILDSAENMITNIQTD